MLRLAVLAGSGVTVAPVGTAFLHRRAGGHSFPRSSPTVSGYRYSLRVLWSGLVGSSHCAVLWSRSACHNLPFARPCGPWRAPITVAAASCRVTF